MTSYNYKDILLQPKFSNLDSRSQANTRVDLGGFSFRLPIIPANMKTVVDEELCVWLAERDYFYVMHRFNVDTVKFVEDMKNRHLVSSISLGVNADSFQTVNDLVAKQLYPDFVSIDIAHGHCIKMQKMLEHVKVMMPDTFVIAGNVCTPDGVTFLEQCGADAISAGIGPGSVCTTKLKTGFSHPQFSAVLECCKVAKKPIIADGGIEHNGDIAKALVAGATMVMAGGIFAGHDESPGRSIIQVENGHEIHYKEFFGSASEHNKGEKKNVEGRRMLIPLKGPLIDTIVEITQDLQSSISYAGGHDLSAFNNVEWVVVH